MNEASAKQIPTKLEKEKKIEKDLKTLQEENKKLNERVEVLEKLVNGIKEVLNK